MDRANRERVEELVEHFPPLAAVKSALVEAYQILVESYQNGGQLLLCGNGGSQADADHIVGELMKGYLLPRPLAAKARAEFGVQFPEDTEFIGRLQQGLPAINLAAHPALLTAISNDIGADAIYAQQVLGYGRPGDVLLGLSTSGSAENVIQAVKVAKWKGLKTLAITGQTGGTLATLVDVAVQVPAEETYRIQEYTLPVYHALCAMVEHHFFGS